MPKPRKRAPGGGRKPIPPEKRRVSIGVRLPVNMIEAIKASGKTPTEAVVSALESAGYGQSV